MRDSIEAILCQLFSSYSHADEALRDQLKKHFSGLQRQGIITSWHDRRVVAGTAFADAIDQNLDTADVKLLLVSPDLIASDYCYEREMKQALVRHKRGDARVTPVILCPCGWHGLGFGTLLATPTDGRAITKWPNIDEAFLNGPLRREGFEYIAKFFENALAELAERNPGVDQSFRRIDANRFTAAAYRGEIRFAKGSASIGGGMMVAESTAYSMTAEPRQGG